MRPHPHTVALADAADRCPRLSDAQRARLKWLAWVHFSSRSTVRAARRGLPQPNFHATTVG